MDVKKTVFVSSTFLDLKEHRRVASQVLEGFKVSVKGMEKFGARSEAPLATCYAEVEQSDVYVGIVAFRLGSVDKASGKSFTQLEYEHAVQLGKEVLIYLADEHAARFLISDIEIDPLARERLAAFKGVLRDNHTTNTFTTPEDLGEKLKTDFSRQFEPREPTPLTSELEATAALARRFMLTPKAVIGRQVRVRVNFWHEPYPASRALCKAFNLGYGETVGCRIKVVAPEGAIQKFGELYATAHAVDRFLKLVESKEPVDLYVGMQFSEVDVPRINASIFGYTEYDYDDDDSGDPRETYVSPEGKAILLFSKVAPAS